MAYGDDRSTLYNAIIKNVQDVIVPDDTFEYIIPAGTAMENAFSSYWEEKDIHRDYWHATDRARVMVSYVWLCRLFGIEQLDEMWERGILAPTAVKRLDLYREKILEKL